MKIIKPYGRSHIEDGNRILRLNREGSTGEAQYVPDFAKSHDALVMAQWISAIDKIATKPKKMNDSATKEQHALRTKLGEAAWTFLKNKKLLSCTGDADKLAHCHQVWQWKITPYEKHGHVDKKVKPKGRWFQRFAGMTVDVGEIDAPAIAEKIYEHLYKAEYRLGESLPKKRRGRIEARAESIAGNILLKSNQGRLDSENNGTWCDDDWNLYFGDHDVAEKIYSAAQKIKNRIRLSDVAAELYCHYGRVFKDENSRPLSIENARARHKGLFHIHMAVKDAYTRILKHHRKKDILKTLPKNKNRLCQLISQQQRNLSLGVLVRLGKVIHYETSANALSQSHYWTSDGQAEIKRSEAFIRIWRLTLGLAARTLKDWADPCGKIKGDILFQIEQAVGREKFNPESYGKKLPLLFGNQAKLFQSEDEEFQKTVLRFALEGVRDLRNETFHFKRQPDFGKILGEVNPNDSDKAKDREDLLPYIQKLWKADEEAQTARVLETLQGAHFDDYFTEDQKSRLFGIIVEPVSDSLPLPRFRHVLRRSDNAWQKRESLGLPAPENQQSLKGHPALLCRYVSLKVVYDRPFRKWLKMRDGQTIKDYIDKAVKRTTKAAQDMNGKKREKEERELIISKAESMLPKMDSANNIEHFFFGLSAATATEMRVQRGYGSDGEKAKSQAKYIEDLKCDVVAIAFVEYVKAQRLDFILDVRKDTQKRSDSTSFVPDTNGARQAKSPESWQAILYFLMHLVPVDEVGKLLHQIRKWTILAPPLLDENPDSTQALAEGLLETLSLYLDMHDAKFDGGDPLPGADGFKALYECDSDFETLFKPPATEDNDDVIPRRGLREIMRFGHLSLMQGLYTTHTIRHEDVEKWTAGKDHIDDHQKCREELHEKWAKRRKTFGDEHKESYKAALARVEEHRHLSAHVTLTNHVRAHRLIMSVLGRLVDFSGLWERDVYFVIRALAKQNGTSPEQIFTEKGLRKFYRGEVTKAVCDLKWNNDEDSDAQKIYTDLCRYFMDLDQVKNYRNDFAHFNMLQKENYPNLTECVNNARTLMAYDRKLKNAVSKSIKEMLDREGVEIEWRMTDGNAPHRLAEAKLESREIFHLGGQKIREALHGNDYVKMIASLFAGSVQTDRTDNRKKPHKNTFRR